MSTVRLHRTTGVRVGDVQIGGGAPVAVQSMTITDTANAAATAAQCVELAEAGSELVRVTVNTPAAAAAVPEIRQRMRDAGCRAPLIGDFHYNGHLLLSRHPDCARALDKYRINPGNVGTGARRDDHFATICRIARDNGKPVRIGVNGGSLDQDLVMAKMQENTDRQLGRTSEEIIDDCMVISAVESTARAIDAGLGPDRIVISCKVSSPTDLISIYRRLAAETTQPLHLGLTEAGMGMKGQIWSAAAMGVLLAAGIGDTVRVSLTPRRPQPVDGTSEMITSSSSPTPVAVRAQSDGSRRCVRSRTTLGERPPAKARIRLKSRSWVSSTNPCRRAHWKTSRSEAAPSPTSLQWRASMPASASASIPLRRQVHVDQELQLEPTVTSCSSLRHAA